MKKVLAILLALTMALSLCSTAWATDGVVETEGEANAPVAQENSIVAAEGEANAPVVQESGGSGSVQTANKITAATTSIGSGTYTLDGNVTLSGTGWFAVEDNAAAVIDLEGNTLHTGAMQIKVGEGATLTVKAGEGGQIVLDEAGIMIFGLLKLESGTIHALTNSDVVFLMGVGSFEMNGGTLLADVSACIDASYGGGKSTITINNGLIETKNTAVNAIYVASRGGVGSVEAVVNGGTIKTGKQAVIACDDAKSTVTVNGGIFDTDVSAFAAGAVAKVTAKGSVNSVFVAGPAYIQQAASVAKTGDKLEVTKGSVSLTGVASGVIVSVASGASATVNNTSVSAGQDYTVPASGEASKNAAKIGTTEYRTLAEAVAAAKAGDTIELLNNCDVSAPISVDKKLTINLNGKTITGKNGDAGCRVFNVVAGGDLTLAGKGTVTTVAKNDSAFVAESSVIRVGDNTNGAASALTIGKEVTINAPVSYGVTIFGTNAKQTLTVNGTVTSAKASAISGNGSPEYKETEITINAGAVVKSTADAGIYHPQKGTLTINGGTIEGLTAVEMKAGTVTVNGGTLTATASVATKKNNNGTSTRGYALALVDNAAYKGAAKAEMKNGSFNGKVGVVKDDDNVAADKKAAASVTGGIFTDNVTSLVPATTPIAKITIGGKTTFVVGAENIQNVAKTAKSGDVIEITQGNVTLTGIAGGVTVKTPGAAAATVNGTAVTAKAYPNGYTVPTYTGGGTGGGFPSSGTKKDDTKKDNIKSATTFDAGIALYVGMSILSLTGTAAVIGKKKEF